MTEIERSAEDLLEELRAAVLEFLDAHLEPGEPKRESVAIDHLRALAIDPIAPMKGATLPLKFSRGVLLCDEPIGDLTQDLQYGESQSNALANGYGARYFIAETMNEPAARFMARMLGRSLEVRS